MFALLLVKLKLVGPWWRLSGIVNARKNAQEKGWAKVIFKMDHSLTFFKILSCSLANSLLIVFVNCRWRDSNPGTLKSVLNALPTVPLHIPELSKQGESKPNPYGFEQFIHSLFQLIRLSHQSSGVRFQYQ